jgi:asparagine synthetase B (glutamine-hydrolysing)
LCDLSGGYDSSTVFAVASRLLQAGASTVGPIISWAYQNERSDESEFRDAVSCEYGIESHVAEMKDQFPFRVLSDAEIPTRKRRRDGRSEPVLLGN